MILSLRASRSNLVTLTSLGCFVVTLLVKTLSIICCLYLSGCLPSITIPTPEARALYAAHLAKKVGWQEHTIHTNKFTLKAYGSSAARKTKILTIYIEGDGLAWLSEERPSNNPSPHIPTGLKMAIHDQKNYSRAYLARPCQFVFKQDWGNCSQAYWTQLRFSPEVIIAMNQAVDYLKKYYHAKQIVLIGYSGGGTIATLIAARRTDVMQLITAAAILDTKYWVSHENLTPLQGSLNPADAWKNLSSIPQTHWVGGRDTVVPKEVADAYAQRFPIKQKPKIIVIPDFDHSCCWATQQY